MKKYLDFKKKEIDLKKLSERVGKNVAEVRKEAKKTQEVLSSELGISRTHLAKIETGKRGMSIKLILNLCKNLNVNPMYLFKEL